MAASVTYSPVKVFLIFIIIIIIITRPWPAFGRQGLVGSSGGYTYHGYTSHASPRACGARLGRIVQELLEYAVLWHSDPVIYVLQPSYPLKELLLELIDIYATKFDFCV